MKAVLLLGTIAEILVVIGWVLGGLWGVGTGLLLAVVIAAATYWYANWFAVRLYKAKPFENEKLQKMISSLSHEAKIPKPSLYVVKSPLPNSFTTGRNARNARIVVSEGLLSLEDEEIEGVLAHEIAHIKNHDLPASTLAALIAGGISFLAEKGHSLLLEATSTQSRFLPLLSIILFAPLACFLLRMTLSEKMEFKADWIGGLLTKKPEALASALRKISQTEGTLQGLAATSHLWIVNPFPPDWFTSLFSIHPPVEKRIERLEVIRSI